MELLIIGLLILGGIVFTFFLFKSWTSTMNSILKTQLQILEELKKSNSK